MRISRKTGLTLAVLALAAGCTPTGQPMGPGQMMSRVGMPGAGGIGAGGIGAGGMGAGGMGAGGVPMGPATSNPMARAQAPMGPATSGPATSGPATSGPSAMGPATSNPVARVQVPAAPATSNPAGRMQMPAASRMPQFRIPGLGRIGAGAAGGAAAAQVTDPYAGQGVRQPGIEPAKPVTPSAPGASASAPVASAPTASAPTASAGTAAQAPAAAAARSHTVVAGETAWSIARKYGVSVQALAAANGLPEAMTVRLGQRLAVPPAAGTRQAAVTAPGAGSPTPLPPSASSPLPSERTTPASRPAPRGEAPDLGATRTAASGSGRLSMPVSGAIVRAYSKGKNEGIDIAAPAGATVKAAGSGTVAAITRDTDGVPIVVIRHDGDLLTVYAGLDNLTVEKGQKVRAGQAIGTARSSGSVHFEVRRGFESVDPEGYL